MAVDGSRVEAPRTRGNQRGLGRAGREKTGPQCWVATLAHLPSGVALGSWWSIIPMAVLALLLIRRTALEDRFLHEHLHGYPDYACRVHFRLIPRVW